MASPDPNALLTELEVEEQHNAELSAALRILLAASKDAVTEIRDRSFARKPLMRAVDKAQDALDKYGSRN